MNEANKHLKSTSGFGDFVNKKTKKGSGYNYTVKYTIIGVSGAGKTTLACDLAIFDIKNYNSVVYVNDHFDDETMAVFRDCCEKSGITYYQVMINEDGSLNVPKVKNALFIIDDTYTSRKRNQNVEKLVSKLIVKGRHPEWSSHIIYIAHLNKYSHMEAINLSTAIFVDSPDDHYPITKEIKPPYNKWYKLTNYLDDNEANMVEVIFPPIKQKCDIIQRLKVKKNKIKNNKEAKEEEYEGIAAGGNAKAFDTLIKNKTGLKKKVDGPIINDKYKLVDGPENSFNDNPYHKPEDDEILIKGIHF